MRDWATTGRDTLDDSSIQTAAAPADTISAPASPASHSAPPRRALALRDQMIACSVGYAHGGLGQHFAQVVEEARTRGRLADYFTPAIKEEDVVGQAFDSLVGSFLLKYSPVRWSAGWRNFLGSDLFDRSVARRLRYTRPKISCFTSFGGMALHSFHAARAIGASRLELVAANSHVNNVARLHALAHERYPGIESSWLNPAQQHKTIEEYELADVVWIASEYTRQSFLREGFPAHKLQRIHYQVDPYFVPPDHPPTDGIFRIAYAGSLTVAKGVPLLIDAFAALPNRNIELLLIGGSGTIGMRRYLADRIQRDPRIRMQAGDPMPLFHLANVYVHPSFEDGLAYAPMEAMACGLPAIVTADTGMKEYIVEGVNGHIIPTGNRDALVDQLKSAMKQQGFH